MDWVPLVLIAFKLVVLGVAMFMSIKWHHDQDQKKKQRDAEARQAREDHASDAVPDASDASSGKP
ncbi:hypothetical protein [Novosphingobium nitrogenifigens]|uniref:hypothetical protein n=1 Tax=Novosphingobium nitrogenifigens TaxID=378548 RepID=UPI000374C6AE|nr:hypothetical protein [Novosphingobium nitrogenifigens]